MLNHLSVFPLSPGVERSCSAHLLLRSVGHLVVFGLVVAVLAGGPVGAQEAGSAAEEAALHLRLGDALRELERNEEAISEFRRALDFDPDDVLAHERLGSLLAAAGDLSAAREHLERAVELEPRASVSHLGLAEVLRRQEQWQGALDAYDLVIALDPTNENPHVGKAETLVGAGRFAEALVAIDRGLEVAPASRGLKFGLAWILAASPDVELRDGPRALVLARELFAARRSVAAAELMAAAHGELGECDQALELQRFVVRQALEFKQPVSSIERLERAAGWYSGSPCRVPASRPASERPAWPRSSKN